MKPIPNGAQGQFVHRVESEHLANRFKDSILPPVFSTPYLILIMVTGRSVSSPGGAAFSHRGEFIAPPSFARSRLRQVALCHLSR